MKQVGTICCFYKSCAHLSPYIQSLNANTQQTETKAEKRLQAVQSASIIRSTERQTECPGYESLFIFGTCQRTDKKHI